MSFADMREIEAMGLPVYRMDLKDYDIAIANIQEEIKIFEEAWVIDIAERALEEVRARIVKGEIGSSKKEWKPTDETIFDFKRFEDDDHIFFDVGIDTVLSRAMTLIDGIYRNVITLEKYDHTEYKLALDELKDIFGI
jgi:hypothetical protein